MKKKQQIMTDQASLRLAVASSGEVWFAFGADDPRRSAQTYSEFVRSPIFRPVRRVFLFGNRDHAAVATDLYRRKLSGDVRSLAVCPSLPSETQYSACCLIHQLKSFLKDGWREAGEIEASSFALAASNEGSLSKLVERHPLYRHLSFVSMLNIEAAGHVMANIIDPRNFRDPEFPDSPLPLQRYFGLVPGISGTHKRRGWLEAAWSQDRPSDTDAPGAFLWRLADSRGLDAASKHFLDYLVSGWRDITSVTHRGRLFVPTLFFQESDSSSSYGSTLRV
jgi:hypothetical protein